MSVPLVMCAQKSSEICDALSCFLAGIISVLSALFPPHPQIIRSMTIDQLKDANRAEAKLLRQRWSSREAMEAVITFFMSRGGGGLAKL